MFTNRDELIQKLADLEIDVAHSPLATQAEPAIAMEISGPSDQQRGTTRLGGDPDLRPGTEWPADPSSGKPLWFLAQFRMEELPDCEGREALPATGPLSFFYDYEEQPWGFDPEDRGFKVIYESDASILERREPPEALLDTIEKMLDERAVFNATNVRLTPAMTLGNVDYEHESSEAEYEVLEEFAEKFECRANWLLGNPLLVQGDVMTEAHYVANGLNTGGETGWDQARADELRPGIADWRLLLQLDTDETDDGPNWMWGDMGRLYFCIRRQDLERHDFSKVWCVLQCG